MGDWDIEAHFTGSGKLAENPPNPDFPSGVDLDLTHGQEPTCGVPLAYPAPCVGVWTVRCTACGFLAIVTAAGRVDDPKFVTIPCKTKPDAVVS